jgi:hypothetical protein
LPLVYKGEQVRFDDFGDQDPTWTTHFVKDDGVCSGDGRFEYHFGRLTGYIDDNSSWVVGSPGWQPLGDFSLEVDARFSDGKYTNTLGLIFGLRAIPNPAYHPDDNPCRPFFYEFYEFLLSYHSRQHTWAVRRQNADDTTDYLETFGGVPSWVGWYDHWNHLGVLRKQDRIWVYINGRRMPGMPDDGYIDGTYGTNRQVGVSIGSWELSSGEIEFDNFRLTPISMPY